MEKAVKAVLVWAFGTVGFFGSLVQIGGHRPLDAEFFTVFAISIVAFVVCVADTVAAARKACRWARNTMGRR